MMNRKSRQREAVLRAVMSTKTHPSAEWVFNEVRREIPNISLGTVYRNLTMLKEAGEIQELCLSNGVARYDGNTMNHYHVMCTQCDSIIDLDFPLIEGIDQQVSEKTGCKILDHKLGFHCICTECLNKSS